MKMRYGWLAAVLGAVMFSAGAPRGEQVMAPRVESIFDVVYVSTSSPSGEVKLDLTWPVSGGPYPVVVYFHGGGWGIGDKAMVRRRMRMLALCGYVVFNANYRLSPEARFPAAVNDALGAVIFAKQRAADYNGDPARVAVMGDSAGAHLAAMVATAWDDPYFTPSFVGDGAITAQVQAGVLMYGIYRPEWVLEQDPKLWGVVATSPMVLAFMGGTPEMKPLEYQEASVGAHLDRKDIPPLFLLCGAADELYPESQWLDQELNNRGVRHKAFFVEGAEHEFNYLENSEDFPYLYAVVDFLEDELKGQ